MNIARFILCSLATLATSLAVAPEALAQPSVTLEERDFAPGSVLTEVGGWGNVGSMSLTPRSSGGNPGLWTEVRINVAGGNPGPPFQAGSSTFGMIFLAGRSIDPSSIGGVATIDVSVDSEFVANNAGGCNCSGQTVLVRQGGVVYAAPLPNTVQVWTAQTAAGLTASNFGRVVFQNPLYFDNTQHPDFGIGAPAIEVGISRGNSNGPGPVYTAYFSTTGLDNLVITAHGTCAVFDASPRPARTCPTGTVPFSVAAHGQTPGELTYQWQIEDPVSPGVWLSMGNDPGPLPGGGSAFAFPTNSPSVSIGVRSRTGVFNIRCVVANTCGSVNSNPATLTISDCAAEVNCDGFVNSADFFDFLTAFFTLAPASDFNADGTINSQDFFDFLAAFFAGC